MTNLFKKTLVAAAIAATTATTAFAAEIATTGEARVSNQGAGLSESVTTPGFTVTLEREYSEDDIITVTLIGAEFGDNAPSLSIWAPDVGGGFTETEDLVLGQLVGDDNTLEYRVTNLGETVNTTIGYELRFGSLTLPTEGLTGDVSVSFAGVTDTDRPIETADAEELVEFVDQFGLATNAIPTSLNAIIDVSAGRQQFENAEVTDSFSLAFEETTGLNLAATATTITHTLYGDFSYTDDEDDFSASVGMGDDTFSVELADDGTSVTIVQTVNGGSIDNPTVTLTVPGVGDGNPQLSAQTFTADVELEYALGDEDDSIELVTGAEVGEWGLNGAQVFVPWIAAGNGITPFFRVTNVGNQEAEIEVEVFTRSGESYTGGVIDGVVLEAESMVRLTLADIERTVGASLFNEDLAITFTINAPAGDITVVAGYNARGNRVVIPTEKLND